MNLLQIAATEALSDSIPSIQEGLKSLSTMSFDELIQGFISSVVTFAVNLAIAAIVFYIGRFLIRKLYSIVQSIFIRRSIDKSLSTFVLSLVRMLLYFILIVTVIGIIGIETSSFIAIFASAGVAIGMALSGTLQNFAGGVLILLLKPYKVGDYIEAQGYSGTVREIQIFHTIICTGDNKSIIIPNGPLSTGTVNNWSRQDYRRVDWTFSLSYGDDFNLAKEKILEILNSDDRVVKHYIEDDRAMRAAATIADSAKEEDASDEASQNRSEKKGLFRSKKQSKDVSGNGDEQNENTPIITKVDGSPSVFLAELADSSINVKVTAWTCSSNYWGVFYTINQRIYEELPKAGLSFPYPQMDVHVINQQS